MSLALPQGSPTSHHPTSPPPQRKGREQPLPDNEVIPTGVSMWRAYLSLISRAAPSHEIPEFTC